MQTEGALLKYVLILLCLRHGDKAYSFSIKGPWPDLGISACVYCYTRESEKLSLHLQSQKRLLFRSIHTFSSECEKSVSGCV